MADRAPARRSYTLVIVIAVIAVIGVWALSVYNGLVPKQEEVRTAWAKVETQYQRRFDLIPNLVNTVKGAANFEQTTLQQVTEARTKWMQSTEPADRIDAARSADSALARLLVTVESYPQLRATEAFRDLQVQLEGTENRITVARNDYNEAVRRYNVSVRTFPGSILASLFGFGPETLFDSTPGAENAPSVDFDASPASAAPVL